MGFAPAAWALWSSGLPATDGERSLVSRARDGEPAAFRAIFDRYAPGVHRLLCDLLRDPAAADEATQETLVRAFHRMDSIRDDDRLVPWLLGIARNVAFEQLRARVRAPVAAEYQPEAVSDATPERSLMGRQAQHALEGALQQLSEGRRAALLLRADHGLPYERIADAMGWSLAKAKVEVHRARQQLRALMGPHLGGP